MKFNSFDKAAFYIVVIDILFLPYIRSISASLSMLIVPLWFVTRSRTIKLKDSDNRTIVLAILLICLSFALSFGFYQNGFYSRSGVKVSSLAMLPNTIIFVLMLSYFVFFKSILIRNPDLNLNFILKVYLVFVFTLSLVFYMNPSLYFDLRALWTMNNNVIEVSDFTNSMFRFTSTMSDPNNIASIVNAILAFLLFCTRQSYRVSLVMALMVIFIVFATMSSSGIIITLLLFTLYLFNILKISTKDKNIIAARVLIVCSLFAFILVFFFQFQSIDVVQVAIERTENNSLSSRFSIWEYSFDLEKLLLTSFFWGDGGLVIMDGQVINPHNGPLHIIYSYGLIVFVCFLYVYFINHSRLLSMESLVLFPLFICFFINVGIYDFRFSMVFSLLIAGYKRLQLNFLTATTWQR